MRNNSITHIYLMPGLAANPSIFDRILLPEEHYQLHRLDWLLPRPLENLEEYARRMTTRIKHENPVLVGVSFGGVLVQEMARFMRVKRLIIISSVKSREELPRRMRFARRTGIYKALPTSMAGRLHLFEKIAMGDWVKKRLVLYRKYMSITDTRYLDWAIEKMVCWEQQDCHPELVHIHGDRDEIFPHRYIRGCITVPGGTHIMIINRFRWFNDHLSEIIETGKIQTKEINENN